MRSLGLHCGHDSSLAIAEDGKIIFAAEEERLTGTKKEVGFPARTLLYACNKLGIGIHDFNKVVYSSKDNFFFRAIDVIHDKDPQNLFPNATFNDHHYSHAVSAYCWSGFDECTVMTLDGGGDEVFATIYEGKNGKLTLIAETKFTEYPFGLFYNQITEICGFKANRHEGKIMGLAAHGKVLNIFENMFWVEGTKIRSNGKRIGKSDVEQIVRKRMAEHFTIDNPAPIVDVAATAQKVFEDIVLEWVLKNAKGKNLAVAGGSFANVLCNMKIAKHFDRFFVCPPMFDDGLAVGAALSVFDPLPVERPKDVYLGFTSPVNPDNKYPADKVAGMIANGMIVGLFQGRMELGPRALGNRSILADPRFKAINITLNKRLHRSEFMPFAPVILEEYADEILIDYDKGKDCGPWMTSCWAVKPEWIPKIQGVVHVDGTARPQVISRETNPYYYDIIDEFRKLTGVPVLINTSFNGHESPIVCFNNEAEYMKKFGMIDVLVEHEGNSNTLVPLNNIDTAIFKEWHEHDC